MCVPHIEERTGTRHVCHSVPVTRTRTVCEDQGHWEEQACGGCAAAPACDSCNSDSESSSCCDTRKVWVPNIVQSEVEYTCYENQISEESYTYNVTTYTQENRTCTVKVARQVQEEVPYTYHVTVCTPQQREVQVQVCHMVEQTVSCKVYRPACSSGCGSSSSKSSGCGSH